MKLTSIFQIGIIVLLGTINNVHSQGNYPITDFDKLVNNSSNEILSRQNFNSQEVDKLRNLVFDLNPMVFLEGKEYKKLGDGPSKILITQSSNLSAVKAISDQIQSVELFIIKHSANNSSVLLDFTTIKTPSLKYVLIECDFECRASNIQKALKNTSNLKILYRITSAQ